MTAPLTTTDTNSTVLLHELFLTEARRAPDALALDIPNGSPAGRAQATYGELALQADAIRQRLSAMVTGESLVALLVPRTSVSAYAAQIGILKAGAAYVSLDPALPDARLSDIVADADPVAVVTDAEGLERVTGLGVDPARVIVTSEADRPDPALGAPSPDWLGPATLAYVIYTSGTTGRPKGVMVEHRAIVNLIAGDLADLGMRPHDRVAQTSSHGYDSSVDEIWMALACGATLVVLDDEAVRAGPDVLPWLERERITVWCPSPSLLRATGCRHRDATPRGIRLVYVGGEAMPPDVVSVWAPGRRLVNGYGPTECTVVATRAEMEPGRPIAIGRPVPNTCAWVLDDANGEWREVPPGERGELCVGGIGLARGYWRAPELTAERFVEHPQFGRFYRTGDLASRSPDGELFCYGRRDAQVKVRGHRVELGDVESHIAHLPGVQAVGCALTGHSLTALVVPTDPSAPPSADVLAALTAAELPSHMVPSRFLTVAALPMTAGGKLDRPALGIFAESALPEVTVRAAAPPETHLEVLIASCVDRALSLRQPAPVDAHLFEALGADSLGAAEIVTALRDHDDTASATVRDVYEAPTIRALAARIAERSTQGRPFGPGVGVDARSGAPADVGERRVARTTIVQGLWLFATFTLSAAVLAAFVLIVLPWLAVRMGLVPFLAAAPFLAALAYVARAAVSTAMAISVKRRLIGRYRAGTEPMWGAFYLRHWIVQRAAGAMPWWLVEGTEFQSMLLRALGARVGRRVHLHRGVDVAAGAWDLLTIGDNVTLGQDAALRPVEIEAGRITVGPIVLEDDVTVEVRAGLGPNTRLGRGSTLSALSSLAANAAVPAGERWTGVPAQPAGPSPARPTMSRPSRELAPVAHGLWMVAARLAVIALAVVPPVAVSIALALAYDATAADVIAWLSSPTWTSTSASAVAIIALVPLPVTLALEAFLLRALGPIAPGVISRWSAEYVRVWLKGSLVDRAGPWLSGSLAWRVWLGMAGARIGRSAEVSTIIDVVPEQLEIGEGTFLTDGIYLGGPRVDRGTVTMAETRLGRRVFIGNHAVVPCGQQIPDDVLVGVCTVADDARIQPGSAWFGHPAFTLARRPDELDPAAFTPTWPRYVARIFFEVARLALPVLPLVVSILWFSSLASAAGSLSRPVFYGVIAPAFTLGAALAIAFSVFALKWTLLGRVRPARHDFWSCWCFRWDLLYVAWQQLARPVLSGLEGTLFLAWYLRAMGARIGRRVVLGRGFAQVVDPDMLHFDDDATVRGLLQAHTFEGRVLKIDRVHVGRGATIGSQALLFYGTDVGDGTRVAAHSVVMKRERLPAGRAYEGCPTRPAPYDLRPAAFAPRRSRTRRTSGGPEPSPTRAG